MIMSNMMLESLLLSILELLNGVAMLLFNNTAMLAIIVAYFHERLLHK